MKIKLITPPGMLFTTAVLAIYACYAFLIGRIEKSWLMLIGCLVAAVAVYATATMKPWSRFAVYLVTAGLVIKLALSVHSAHTAGYFDVHFDSSMSALIPLLPAITMAALGLVCCVIVTKQFARR